MNKKTYGDGTRIERTDHTVVAETVAAKEKLRDQLGEGEEVKVITPLEAAELELRQADAEWHQAEEAYLDIVNRRYAAEARYREAYDALAKLKEEQGDA